jgi:hypothetical protein
MYPSSKAQLVRGDRSGNKLIIQQYENANRVPFRPLGRRLATHQRHDPAAELALISASDACSCLNR